MDKKFEPTRNYYLQFIVFSFFCIGIFVLGFFLSHGTKDELLLNISNAIAIIVVLFILYSLLSIYVRVSDDYLIYKNAWAKEKSIPLSNIDHIVYGFNLNAGYSGAYEFKLITKENSTINIPITSREDEIIALILQRINVRIIKHEPISKQLTNLENFL